jgi:hypothetical protein
MAIVVTAMFGSAAAAHQAVQELLHHGFLREVISVVTRSQEARSGVSPERAADEGIAESFGKIFTSLLTADGAAQEADRYAEEVLRGGTLVTVKLEKDSPIALAVGVLQRHEALSIEERVTEEATSSDYGPMLTTQRSTTREELS